MKITREINGKPVEFHLTPDELYLAFEEQEHLFDRQDVLSYFDGYEDEDFLSEYNLSKEDVLSRVDDLAYEMRRNITKYDMDWQSARDAAVSELL